MEKKALVAYFSASGVTARLARQLAGAIGAELYEIKPAQPYTDADLDWRNSSSRSSVEMRNPASRPAIAGAVEGMEGYDTIFVGFPIWWYVAPKIINTFLESYDLTGKTVIPFATSGSSGMGETNAKLAPGCAGARLLDGRLLNGRHTDEELREWARQAVL